jgi:tripartite-type tricarboxylate transporter receptor subunit TctC
MSNQIKKLDTKETKMGKLFLQSTRALSLMATLSWLFLASFGSAHAQNDYPNRLVKIVVPYPAGGTTDIVTRLYAQELSIKLGQQFVVENRPGGGTNVGAEAVANSAPDGHTLFVVQSASHGVNPSLFKKLNYDPIKDFAAVGLMTRSVLFLIAHQKAPFNNMKEMLVYAKDNPGKLNYASQGNGSPGHLGGALLTLRTGVQLVHIPYKGAAQALADIASGEAQMGFLSYDGVAKGLVKNGRLKVLAVAAGERWVNEPSIPSMAESGVLDFQVRGFFGLSAPAKTPDAILEKLSQAMREIGAREDIKQKVLDMGLAPISMTRPEMTQFINTEIAYWRPVVKATGVTID